MLLFATLKKLNNEQCDEENLLCLAGVYKAKNDIFSSKVPATVINYLKNNPHIDTIIMHFDNDSAGRIATKVIQNSFSDSYKVIDEPPKMGKDFNDFLCMQLGIYKREYYKDNR